MHYQTIRKFDTANGEGCRVTIFVSGCSFACPGCFNHGAWSYKSGQPFTQETLQELLDACADDAIAGLSILGGEPMEPRNVDQVQAIVMAFKARYPNKTVWLWTGFEMAALVERAYVKGDEATEALLSDLDVIIDGKYEQDKPTHQPYRGSDNQIMWIRKGNPWTGHPEWQAFQKSYRAYPIIEVKNVV